MRRITIRDPDHDIIARLKARAQTNGRSLEAEVYHALTQAASVSTTTGLRALAERIAAMTPGMPQIDSTDLLRKDHRR